MQDHSSAQSSVCGSCSTECAFGSSTCSACGGLLSAEERRIVTVVFCDLVDSTGLAGQLDPERLRALLLRYYASMRERIEASGGVVEKFIGDAVVAVFGLPATREDDARRALEAALGMLDAAEALRRQEGDDEAVRIRVGVHTGEVVTIAERGPEQGLVSGEVVNIAARLQAETPVDTVALSAATLTSAGRGVHTRELGSLRLRGVRTPVDASILVAITDDEAAVFETPFTGRNRELAVLDLTWRRVVEEAGVQVVTLLGDAGMGKSRLVSEWLGQPNGPSPTAVGRGRARSALGTGSLAPLAECLVSLLAGSDTSGCGTALEVLRDGLLRDGTPAPSFEETCAAVVDVLSVLALRQPLFLLFDDCHDAQTLFFDGLDRILDGLGGLPVFVVCLARPDLLDEVSGWGTGRAGFSTMMLSGLSAPDSELLAARLLEVVPHGRVTELVRRAAGNPHHIEQLAAAMSHDADDALPPSLHAALAARIDRLPPTERQVLRLAALMDGEIPADRLQRLAEGLTPDCTTALRALVRHRFVEPVRRGPDTVPVFTLVSSIARQVAYEGLTKRHRAVLHERLGDLLAAEGATPAQVGFEMAKAHRYRAQLGALTPSDVRLRRRAAELLEEGGGAALRRVDLPQAVRLLEAAAELAEHTGNPGDGADTPPELRARILSSLGETYFAQGRLDAAIGALSESRALAQAAGHVLIAARAELSLAAHGNVDEALVTASRTRAVFNAHGDTLGLARCHLILAGQDQRAGRFDSALGQLESALSQAVSARADLELANSLGAIGLSLWHGPQPALAAIGRCEELLARYGGNRLAVQATLGFALTALHQLAGRFDDARTVGESTAAAMRALDYAEASVFLPWLKAIAPGEAIDAAQPDERRLALLSDALAAANAIPAPGLALPVALELARALLESGDFTAAESLVRDWDTSDARPQEHARHLGIRARIGAVGGAAGAADLAVAAIAVAARTDSPSTQAEAHLDLAGTLVPTAFAPVRPATIRQAARDEAINAVRTARGLYGAKQHLAGVARADGLLRTLGRGGS